MSREGEDWRDSVSFDTTFDKDLTKDPSNLLASDDEYDPAMWADPVWRERRRNDPAKRLLDDIDPTIQMDRMLYDPTYPEDEYSRASNLPPQRRIPYVLNLLESHMISSSLATKKVNREDAISKAADLLEKALDDLMKEIESKKYREALEEHRQMIEEREEASVQTTSFPLSTVDDFELFFAVEEDLLRSWGWGDNFIAQISEYVRHNKDDLMQPRNHRNLQQGLLTLKAELHKLSQQMSTLSKRKTIWRYLVLTFGGISMILANLAAEEQIGKESAALSVSIGAGMISNVISNTTI